MKGYITSTTNSLVKHFVKLRTSAKYRYLKRSVPILGKTMVNEVGAKFTLQNLLILKDLEVPKCLKPVKSCFRISSSVLEKISGISGADSMMAEVTMPPEQPFSDIATWKHTLVLDQVMDPGNLGTLIRTAHCLGWDGVCLVGNCVDIFNEKALRAAKSSTFSLPYVKVASLDDMLDGLQTFPRKPEEPMRIAWVATVKSDQGIANFSKLVGDFSKSPFERGPQLLVLGHESHGVSKISRGNSTVALEPVTLPMLGSCDSLNVAICGALLMWCVKPVTG